MSLALAARRLLLTPSGIAWFRRPEHVLDGVAPGFFADIPNRRQALGGASVDLAALLAVTAAAGKTYVDACGILRTAAANEARIDHASGARELLLEGAATNRCPFSNDPTNTTHWLLLAGNMPITGIDDPAGGTLARRVTANGTTNTRYSACGAAVAFTAGTTYTLSRFIRAGTETMVQLTGVAAAFGSGQYANFDIAAGAIGSYAGCAPAIERLGATGWYRISIAVTATTTSAGALGSVVAWIGSLSSPRLPSNAKTTSFDEAFPQVEGGSVATSYIPTYDSAVTRSADLCQLTPAATAVLQGAAAAVAWRGVVPVAIADQVLLGIPSGNRLVHAGSGDPTRAVGSGNSGGFYLTTGSHIPGSSGIAFGFGAAGRIGAVNGLAAATGAGAVVYSRASLFIGPSDGLAAGQVLRLRQLVGWPLADRPSAAGIQAQARTAS